MFLADPRAAYERALCAAAVLLASTGLLFGAILIDQALGYAPCELCILQRWPHGVAALLAALALGVSHSRPRTYAAAMAAAGAALAAGAVVAGYHSGVEAGLWAGPASCTAGASAPVPGSVGELMAALERSRPVRCDVPAFRVLGLSLANMNLAASAVLSAASASACVPRLRSRAVSLLGGGARPAKA